MSSFDENIQVEELEQEGLHLIDMDDESSGEWIEVNEISHSHYWNDFNEVNEDDVPF